MYSPTLELKMEGACGKILATEDPKVVLKKVHRRNRAQQRTSSLGAEQQARMQDWVRNLCLKEGFQILFVPRAWDAEKYSYKMDRIQTEKALEISESLDSQLLKELKALYKACMSKGIFPVDYELYEQKDGRVAMVDFDKFSTWTSDGLITFPWGSSVQDTLIKDQYPYLFS
jgi:hypothetical protein